MVMAKGMKTLKWKDDAEEEGKQGGDQDGHGDGNGDADGEGAAVWWQTDQAI